MAQPTVNVKFKTHYFTSNPVERLAIVGSLKPLGNWTLEKCAVAVENQRYKGHWTVFLTLPVNSYFEWKWVVVTSGKNRTAIRYEERANRKTGILLPKPSKSLEIVAPWNDNADIFADDGNQIKSASVYDISIAAAAKRPEVATTVAKERTPADTKEKIASRTTKTDYTFHDGVQDWKTTKTSTTTTSGRKEVSTTIASTNVNSEANKTLSASHGVKTIENSKETPKFDKTKASDKTDITSKSKVGDVLLPKPVDASDVEITIQSQDQTKPSTKLVGTNQHVDLKESSKVSISTKYSTEDKHKHSATPLQKGKSDKDESDRKNANLDKGKQSRDKNKSEKDVSKTSQTKDSSRFEEIITPVKEHKVETSVPVNQNIGSRSKQYQKDESLPAVEEIVVPRQETKVESSVSYYRSDNDTKIDHTQDSRCENDLDLDNYVIRTVKVTAETKEGATPKDQTRKDTIITSTGKPGKSDKKTVPDLSVFQKIASPTKPLKKESDAIITETSTTKAVKSSKDTGPDLSTVQKITTKKKKVPTATLR